MHPVRTLALAIAVSLAAPVMAQAPATPAKPAATPAASGPTASDMEILRQKLKADKKLLIAENMQLTEAEAKAFWPLYEEYVTQVIKLGDRSSALITDFARNYEKLSDDQARSMLKEQMDIQEQSLALRRETMKKMEGVLPPQKLARFFQIENKFDAEVSCELAKMVPLAEPK